MVTETGPRYDTRKEVDFVIIGSGASGGVLARELSVAGYEARHAWTPPFGAYDAAVAGEVGHGD